MSDTTRYAQTAYNTVRQSWQDHIEMFGLTTYNAPRLHTAYHLWATNRPEYTANDNWLTAADEWHRTYLARRNETPQVLADSRAA